MISKSCSNGLKPPTSLVKYPVVGRGGNALWFIVQALLRQGMKDVASVVVSQFAVRNAKILLPQARVSMEEVRPKAKARKPFTVVQDKVSNGVNCMWQHQHWDAHCIAWSYGALWAPRGRGRPVRQSWRPVRPVVPPRMRAGWAVQIALRKSHGLCACHGKEGQVCLSKWKMALSEQKYRVFQLLVKPCNWPNLTYWDALECETAPRMPVITRIIICLAGDWCLSLAPTKNGGVWGTPKSPIHVGCHEGRMQHLTWMLEEISKGLHGYSTNKALA